MATLFGSRPPGRPKGRAVPYQLTLGVSEDLLAALDALADEYGISRAEAVRGATMAGLSIYRAKLRNSARRKG